MSATVRLNDYRTNTTLVVSEHDTEDAAYDAAANVARGMAKSLGIGGCVTEQAHMTFEVWRNGALVADVFAS